MRAFRTLGSWVLFLVLILLPLSVSASNYSEEVERAVALAKNGEPNHARHILEKILQKDPNNEVAKGELKILLGTNDSAVAANSNLEFKDTAQEAQSASSEKEGQSPTPVRPEVKDSKEIAEVDGSKSKARNTERQGGGISKDWLLLITGVLLGGNGWAAVRYFWTRRNGKTSGAMGSQAEMADSPMPQMPSPTVAEKFADASNTQEQLQRGFPKIVGLGGTATASAWLSLGIGFMSFLLLCLLGGISYYLIFRGHLNGVESQIVRLSLLLPVSISIAGLWLASMVFSKRLNPGGDGRLVAFFGAWMCVGPLGLSIIHMLFLNLIPTFLGLAGLPTQ